VQGICLCWTNSDLTAGSLPCCRQPGGQHLYLQACQRWRLLHQAHHQQRCWLWQLQICAAEEQPWPGQSANLFTALLFWIDLQNHHARP